MALAGIAGRRGHRAHGVAVPPAFAAREGGDESLSRPAQRLDRRGLLPLGLRRASLQRGDGAVLGRDGRRVDLRYCGELHHVRADPQARPHRVRLLPHAVRLPALLAAAGIGVPDGHLARHALFGGGLHHRAAARFLETGESVRDSFPVPLGVGGLFEDLFLRHPRGFAAGQRVGSGSVPLFQGVYRPQFPPRHQARPPGDEFPAGGHVDRPRGLLLGDRLAAGGQ